MNASKTQCMFIGTTHYISRIGDNRVVKCEEEEIKISHYVKDLGLHMDRYMTFGHHIDELSRKVSGILMYLSKIKGHFEDSTRALIIQSLVLSVINYCIKIWGATSDLYMNRVQKLMNFAARVAVVGVKKYDHITPTLQKLEWLRIKEKYAYEICIFVFKVLKSEYPSWLYSFTRIGNYREASTRQNNDLYVKNYRTDLGARSNLIRSPFFWNSLPQDIRECANVKGFKTKIKYYFLNKI